MKKTLQIIGREGGGVVIGPGKTAKVGDSISVPDDVTPEAAAVLIGNGRAIEAEAPEDAAESPVSEDTDEPDVHEEEHT